MWQWSADADTSGGVLLRPEGDYLINDPLITPRLAKMKKISRLATESLGLLSYRSDTRDVNPIF